ncbi:MAG TPA: hypothetical protein VLT62_29000 [Candidatus Methylomirabilis sp.]|nr:hypothetical protein [Candidatus Methylomirabilis sp.]
MNTGRGKESVRGRVWGSLGLVALAGMVLSACGAPGTYRTQAEAPPAYPPAVFAHRVATADVEIYWNCSHPGKGVLRVNGVAKNSGGREVRFLELQLDAMDGKNRNILHTATAIPDILLYTNQSSPFQLDLRTTGAEVRYDLFYQYNLGRRIGFQDTRFMARDVCSETQHRITNMSQ